jgi:iron uptake system component EfeO
MMMFNRSRAPLFSISGIAPALRGGAMSISLACCALSAVGCGDESSARTPEQQATLDVKEYVSSELVALADAALRLQEAAPEPDGDGWNPQDDGAAVEAMRAAWAETRDHYERVEGAIAVLFPNLDVSTDERYDGFIAEGPDENLFDGEGVTGMHAIERILWAGAHPPNVVAFESGLDGYVPAAFPADEAEAQDFADGLAQRLVDDTETMRDDFEPLALDASAAFRGVIGSLEEQLEKVSRAATAEDESRYAQRTLDDMRANLAGGVATYAAFRDWVIAEAGTEVDADVRAGFAAIDDAYEEIDGAAIPEVPAGFNPAEPSEEHLQTPYGELYLLLTEQADPGAASSLVSAMLEAADAMGIPELPE